MADKKEEGTDPRLEFICSRLLKMMNFKMDKWNKLMSTSDNRTVIDEFLNNSSNQMLTLFNNGSIILPYLNQFPYSGKGTFLYFIRKNDIVELTKANMNESLMTGTCSSNPLDDLNIMINHVFVPILMNPLNQQNWSKNVVTDVKKELQTLRNNILGTIGNMNYTTVLPMPLTDTEISITVTEMKRKNTNYCDINLRESLEELVFQWNDIIKKVAKHESYTIFNVNIWATPNDEIHFWNIRLKNLENLHAQILGDFGQDVSYILDKTNSVCASTLRRLQSLVEDKTNEARDLNRYLRGMQRQIDIFETASFDQMFDRIRPLVHVICNIWSHSQYCCTNKRMLHLFKLTHNMLMTQATNCLGPESIMQGELDDNLAKIKRVFAIFKEYKLVVMEYWNKLETFLKPNSKAQWWSFKPTILFADLELYLQRLTTLQNILDISFQFKKLDDILVGGLSGNKINAAITDVLARFDQIKGKLEKELSGILNIFEKNRGENALNAFFNDANDLERILAKQFNFAFDECTNSLHMAEIFLMLGTSAYRPIIYPDIEHRITEMITRLYNEVLSKKQTFERKLTKITNNNDQMHSENYAAFSRMEGNLYWMRQLRHDIEAPVTMIGYLLTDVFTSDFGIHVKMTYQNMLERLQEYENELVETQCIRMVEFIQIHMERSIMVRNSLNELLAENFSDELEATLQNLKCMQSKGIPISDPTLADFVSQEKRLWTVRQKLRRVAQWYNDILLKPHETEKNLIYGDIKIIDEALTDGLGSCNWKNFELSYIDNIYDSVKKVHDRLSTAQSNVNAIIASIQNWSKVPHYTRKDMKPEALLNIADRDSIVAERQHQCLETNNFIEQTMLTNQNVLLHSVLRLDETPSGNEQNIEQYRLYEEYVDKLIASELCDGVQTSIRYIQQELDEESNTPLPLFHVSFLLQNSRTVFMPSMDNSYQSLSVLIESIINDIFDMGKYIKRVALQSLLAVDGSDAAISDCYLPLIASNSDILTMKSDILHQIADTCKIVRIRFLEYDLLYGDIWSIDRGEYLQQFLQYGRALLSSEVAILNTSEFTIKNSPPNLTQFRAEIDRYMLIESDAKNITKIVIIVPWLRIKLVEFTRSLLHEIRLWISLFKNYLRNGVTSSLQDLEDFLSVAMIVLTQKVEKKELDKLLKIMSYLDQVNARKSETDAMFDTIKAKVELMREYQEEFDVKVNKQCSELPDQWNKLKKAALTISVTIAPVKIYQANLVSKRIIILETRMKNYRQLFKIRPFFEANCLNAYKHMNESKYHMDNFRMQFSELLKLTETFELPPPVFNHIEYCMYELKLAKQLWDAAYVIQATVNSWKKTMWTKLDIETTDQECKTFAKDLRTLAKDVHIWEPYKIIESTVKNLMAALRAIAELRNPSLRPRHWGELARTTQVQFNMTDSTTLSNLLDLNLYKYEEEIKDVVDMACKEMAMEKLIKDIDTNWKQFGFDYDVHGRTQLKLLRLSEELLEVLEDNQNQLNNAMSSKYITFFFTEISGWQQKLSLTDQVIKEWFEVQRKWTYLESIFIGSEDIRNELPEDTQRFIMIDNEFKNLLELMTITPNIVESCSHEGLVQTLERLQSELVICEKALNEYLETKRLAFPRFYFISSVDLLDILSNGSTPKLVCKHLTKLFDSLAKLNFKGNSKISVSMESKENGEVVPFISGCDCDGQVEIWLNRVTKSMRTTLHSSFHASVRAYEEKSRDEWIFDWPAQPALCVTQIWWSSETYAAFKRLEGGYENALRDYQKKQINQLNALIVLLLGKLSAGDRQKIMTICTIDVHSRDVVAKLIVQKVKSSLAFQWQSQLRHRWDDTENNCFVNICDAQFTYDFEYLGNTPRLVITPLTDRCYITLTQSLHLIMGGAPAGPAGTGKTETTKDLGKGLGIMVYVFNCSEQMDYKSCGNIYKGLALTGAWGCFDEFNRISVEVLSVVAVQVKTILDAIKTKKERFTFMGELIDLIPTVGVFITMNPGYAGRTELPENLKVLFRPCAMVVPDFALISEIMLVAEAFQEAKLLSRKFITLYTLCKELLSKQDHYDWGLRAIKSVLVVAGSLRRDDPSRPEDQVLMRALRDFNIPKIVTDDVAVFMGLIGDLFPGLDVPRKRDLEFEGLIKKAARNLNLQPEDGFVLKVVQLEELFAVRHSVFVVGFAGTGKSEVWKTLNQTYTIQNRKPYYNDLNPKAVTNDELFGIINPATREWKDGLFSVIMRDQANMPGTGPKWIVLDGDIDPMWIESLNTLMDDNKILTLASNERIALTKEMRLLFEIASLKTATPATVSRAGILYINSQDLGWNPFVASWIESRPSQEGVMLTLLFDRYIPTLLNVMSIKFKTITPIPEIAMLQMTCHLLECLLTPQNLPQDSPKEWYEIYFVFAVIWGFGATLFKDQLVDGRNEFSKWWLNEFQVVRFPTEAGNIFSYFVDPVTKAFTPWTELVPAYELDTEIPLQSVLVGTSETAALRYFMDMLIQAKHPVMLIGPAGTGKTVMVSDKLNSLSLNYLVTDVPLNYYTTSEMLQNVLEKPLEKKAGRNFGPVGNKTMIYFVDDLNMPLVDTYGTVQAHTLIRQYMDYRHWYDRAKLSLKDIQQCQFISCMNPTAGSFTIDPRLQRHFSTFAVNFPLHESVQHIYSSILSQYIALPGNAFSPLLNKEFEDIVHAAIALHQRMSQNFLPTAIKFHYNFNLREMANVFTGMMFAKGDCVPNRNALIRLWAHESMRVYGDKMATDEDVEAFGKCLKEIVAKTFNDVNMEFVFNDPVIFFHYAEGLNDAKYMPVKEWKGLKKILEDGLTAYGEMVSVMNLVLFEEAMSHICRISRILSSDRGYVLLIGVGGSGKQSLTRLAAFISVLEVFQTQLKKGFSVTDLKADLATLYMKTGVKNGNCCYLMTDSQVAEEEFLVVINDLLASGNIPDLFPPEDVENIVNAVRNEVKQAGIMDTTENCWKFFINKVRRMLKVVLCFSPVGSTLRVRARKFPSVVNCTNIDWFHEWPRSALESVSKRFLAEIEVLPTDLINPIGSFMAYVHDSVNSMSKNYLLNEKRYNYTTPKTFLELIELYSKLLTEKYDDLVDRIAKLENGLMKLANCDAQVEGLQVTLKEQEIVLAVKNAEANKQFVIVATENDKVQLEKNAAFSKEQGVRVIEEDVSAKTKVCEEDLKKAEPAMQKAAAALNTLDKNNLTELKSFGSPSEAVVSVCSAVMVLMANASGNVPKDRSWKQCKIMMNKVDKFLSDLQNYDKKNIKPQIITALLPYVKNPEFNPDIIRGKSEAAGGLCEWVTNIYNFYIVYLDVGPKEKALEQSKKQLQDAQNTLSELTAKLKILQDQLDVLQAQLDEAAAAKEECQAEADKTEFKIQLAHRLVNGLASNKIRWTQNIADLKNQRDLLPGDILQVACFISYVGGFTSSYRNHLQNNLWIPALINSNPVIPISENKNPMEMVCDEAKIAEWNNQGLPNDRMSVENAIILTNSARWPLMIDPQLQGIKWIKQKYGDTLTVTRLTLRNYLDIIEKSVRNGEILLVENIGESIDAVLDPLLGRMLIKKGKVLKLGDREIDYNANFRLILHTKLANPHYKPELQAQTTLINFSVTRDGLEQQLLAEVVKVERPDLEQLKTKLTTEQNSFKITLIRLEEDLLYRLSSAGENVLEDETLVLNLETTKKTAADIEEKVKLAKVTTIDIDRAREQYRPVSERSAIIYFVLNDFHKINKIYQFSLKAFTVVFHRAIALTPDFKELQERVQALLDSITYQIYMHCTRALFERDKIILKAQVTLQILLNANKIDPIELDYLLRFPCAPNSVSPLDFISNTSWGGIVSLSKMDSFTGLDRDLEGSAKRWNTFVNSECPEKEKFPGEWKNKSPLQRLCIMRVLRPDRMANAMLAFVEEEMGPKYTQSKSLSFEETFEEASNVTHMFFTLSPGVDPLKDVEGMGKKLNFSMDNGNFHSISLGQGQEIVAEKAIDIAAREGHWVMLQNIHLVAKWLPILEKKIESVLDSSHYQYRLFLSAEAAPSPEYHILPQGILESAIKVTNEPPTGMQANLHKALNNFSDETLDMCSKVIEFKAILFSLCYFHAVVAERRKFGALGWNRIYPFNFGDLTISVSVLYNYLEANSAVPWEDLRYLFGEIMYGGHLTDDFDRRLCRTYLEEYMQHSLIEAELIFATDFQSPPSMDCAGYHNYIDDKLPPESPTLYGLHTNAEIGVLTSVSEQMFKTIFELQPQMKSSGSGDGQSREEVVKLIIEDLLEKIPQEFPLTEMMSRVEGRSPYTIVAFQECDRMNMLTREIKRSLTELMSGLKGMLTITSNMEALERCIFFDTVPDSWSKLAYPSMMGLQSWFGDLILRLRQLESWTNDFSLPSSVWLAGFFNPQSFLTAIMQQTARKNQWPLDAMCLNCDVTKKCAKEILAPPREGAFISGLFMEGARWDSISGSIADSNLKELFPSMPVVYVVAMPQEKKDVKNVYECPVYKIRLRGPTYVWTFNLKTKVKSAKWILAGVCVLLHV